MLRLPQNPLQRLGFGLVALSVLFVQIPPGFSLPGFTAKTRDFSTLAIPQLLGHVGGVHESLTSSAESPWILLIQDAHVNYSAQKNMAAILGHLNEHYGVTLTLVEGAQGDVDLSYLRGFGTLTARQDVSDEYLKKGIIAGEEYFDIATNSEMLLWGVEDLSVYVKAYHAFLYAEKENAAFKALLAKLRQVIDVLTEERLPESLHRFDQDMEAYETEDGLGFGPKIKQLRQASRAAHIDLEDYPQINLFSQIQSLNYHRDLVNEEQKTLLKELQTQLDKERLTVLIQALKDLKSKTITQADYFAQLQSFVEEAGMSFKGLPNLEQHMQSVLLNQQLNIMELLKESGRLMWAVRFNMVGDESAQRLLLLEDQLRLFEGLVELELNSDDYALYQDRLDAWSFTQWYSAILDEIYPIELSVLTEAQAQAYEQSLNKIESFYQLTFARDEAMMERIQQKVAEQEARASALVVGGFHTQSLVSKLTQNGLNVAVIVPAAEEDPAAKELYKKNLKRRNRIFEADDWQQVLSASGFLRQLEAKHGWQLYEKASGLYEVIKQIIRRLLNSDGNYFTGLPDFIKNVEAMHDNWKTGDVSVPIVLSFDGFMQAHTIHMMQHYFQIAARRAGVTEEDIEALGMIQAIAQKTGQSQLEVVQNSPIQWNLRITEADLVNEDQTKSGPAQLADLIDHYADELEQRTGLRIGPEWFAGIEIDYGVREVLEGEYGLPKDSIVRVTEIGRGISAIGFRVDLSDGRSFVLRRSAITNPAVVTWDQTIRNIMTEAGVQTVLPMINSTQGEAAVHTIADGLPLIWTLMPWVEGEEGEWGQVEGDRLRSSARALAQFHDAATQNLSHFEALSEERRGYIESMPVVDIFNLDDIRRRLADFEQTIRARAPPPGTAEAFFLDNYDIYVEHLNQLTQQVEALLSSEQQMTVVHGDYHPKNVLFQGNEIVQIFDFDYAHIAPRILDLASVMVDYGGEYGLENIKQFVAAYQSETKNPLNEAELRLLVEAYRRLLIQGVLLNAQHLVDRTLFGTELQILQGVKRGLVELDGLDWDGLVEGLIDDSTTEGFDPLHSSDGHRSDAQGLQTFTLETTTPGWEMEEQLPGEGISPSKIEESVQPSVQYLKSFLDQARDRQDVQSLLPQALQSKTLEGAEVLLIGPGEEATEVIALLEAYPGIAAVHVMDPRMSSLEAVDSGVTTFYRNQQGIGERKHIMHQVSVAQHIEGLNVDLVIDKQVFDRSYFSDYELIKVGTNLQRYLAERKGVHVSLGHPYPWREQLSQMREVGVTSESLLGSIGIHIWGESEFVGEPIKISWFTEWEVQPKSDSDIQPDDFDPLHSSDGHQKKLVQIADKLRQSFTDVVLARLVHVNGQEVIIGRLDDEGRLRIKVDGEAYKIDPKEKNVVYSIDEAPAYIPGFEIGEIVSGQVELIFGSENIFVNLADPMSIEKGQAVVTVIRNTTNNPTRIEIDTSESTGNRMPRFIGEIAQEADGRVIFKIPRIYLNHYKGEGSMELGQLGIMDLIFDIISEEPQITKIVIEEVEETRFVDSIKTAVDDLARSDAWGHVFKDIDIDEYGTDELFDYLQWYAPVALDSMLTSLSLIAEESVFGRAAKKYGFNDIHVVNFREYSDGELQTSILNIEATRGGYAVVDKAEKLERATTALQTMLDLRPIARVIPLDDGKSLLIGLKDASGAVRIKVGGVPYKVDVESNMITHALTGETIEDGTIRISDVSSSTFTLHVDGEPIVLNRTRPLNHSRGKLIETELELGVAGAVILFAHEEGASDRRQVFRAQFEFLEEGELSINLLSMYLGGEVTQGENLTDIRFLGLFSEIIDVLTGANSGIDQLYLDNINEVNFVSSIEKLSRDLAQQEKWKSFFDKAIQLGKGELSLDDDARMILQLVAHSLKETELYGDFIQEIESVVAETAFGRVLMRQGFSDLRIELNFDDNVISMVAQRPIGSTRQDPGHASDNQAGTTRSEHLEYHTAVMGNSELVPGYRGETPFDRIAQGMIDELNQRSDVNINIVDYRQDRSGDPEWIGSWQYDYAAILREASRLSKENISQVNWKDTDGSDHHIRIEPALFPQNNGAVEAVPLVVVRSPLFGADHLGRSQGMAVGRTEAKVQHELHELKGLYPKLVEWGVVTWDQIRANEVGVRIRLWANGLTDPQYGDYSASNEEKNHRQTIYLQVREESHTEAKQLERYHAATGIAEDWTQGFDAYGVPTYPNHTVETNWDLEDAFYDYSSRYNAVVQGYFTMEAYKSIYLEAARQVGLDVSITEAIYDGIMNRDLTMSYPTLISGTQVVITEEAWQIEFIDSVEKALKIRTKQLSLVEDMMEIVMDEIVKGVKQYVMKYEELIHVMDAFILQLQVPEELRRRIEQDYLARFRQSTEFTVEEFRVIQNEILKVINLEYLLEQGWYYSLDEDYFVITSYRLVPLSGEILLLVETERGETETFYPTVFLRKIAEESFPVMSMWNEVPALRLNIALKERQDQQLSRSEIIRLSRYADKLEEWSHLKVQQLFVQKIGWQAFLKRRYELAKKIELAFPDSAAPIAKDVKKLLSQAMAEHNKSFDQGYIAEARAALDLLATGSASNKLVSLVHLVGAMYADQTFKDEAVESYTVGYSSVLIAMAAQMKSQSIEAFMAGRKILDVREEVLDIITQYPADELFDRIGELTRPSTENTISRPHEATIINEFDPPNGSTGSATNDTVTLDAIHQRLGALDRQVIEITSQSRTPEDAQSEPGVVVTIDPESTNAAVANAVNQVLEQMPETFDDLSWLDDINDPVVGEQQSNEDISAMLDAYKEAASAA